MNKLVYLKNPLYGGFIILSVYLTSPFRILGIDENKISFRWNAKLIVAVAAQLIFGASRIGMNSKVIVHTSFYNKPNDNGPFVFQVETMEAFKKTQPLGARVKRSSKG